MLCQALKKGLKNNKKLLDNYSGCDNIDFNNLTERSAPGSKGCDEDGCKENFTENRCLVRAGGLNCIKPIPSEPEVQKSGTFKKVICYLL